MTTLSKLFFQDIGGIVGLAIMNTVFCRILNSRLEPILKVFPEYTSLINRVLDDANLIRKSHFPLELRSKLIHAFSDSISQAYYVLVLFTLVGCLATCFLPKLRPASSQHDLNRSDSAQDTCIIRSWLCRITSFMFFSVPPKLIFVPHIFFYSSLIVFCRFPNVSKECFQLQTFSRLKVRNSIE